MIQRLLGGIIPLIFLLGIFIPTSINGQITTQFSIIGCTLLVVLLIILLIMQKGISIQAIIILILTNFLLFLFTLLSPLPEYRFGTSLYFFILTLIFCLDFKNINVSLSFCRKVLQIVNIILIAFSFSIILKYMPINTFLKEWYSAFYVELIPSMFSRLKPVSVFGSHSIAGFYFFVLFLINFLTYYYLKMKRHLVIGIFYMIFLFYIQSSTSLVYFLICFLVIMIILFKKSRVLFFVVSAVLIIILLNKYQEITIFQLTSTKIFSEGNGLFSRYSSNGVLNNNINYIKGNPFRGLGFSYSPDYVYVDSGIVEYTLRGSIFVLFIILLGLFNFFKRNLDSNTSITLFFLFLSFEIGFTNLIYFRSLFILPFIVAYLYQLKFNKTLIVKLR